MWLTVEMLFYNFCEDFLPLYYYIRSNTQNTYLIVFHNCLDTDYDKIKSVISCKFI